MVEVHAFTSGPFLCLSEKEGRCLVLRSLFRSKETDFSDDLVSMVNAEYIRRQSERRPFEMQWRLNIEFINGNQYLDINTVTSTIEEIPKLYWHQEREVFNQIAPIHDTRVARLSRHKPFLKARPASSDDEDIASAKISTMLLSSTWDDQNMDDKYVEFISWLESTGTAFWVPTWSINRGRLVYRGQDPQMMQPQEFEDEQLRETRQTTANEEIPVSDPELAERFQQDAPIVEIREGDIDTDVCSPFEIYPDSSFRTGVDKCRSIIRARALHVDEIEERFGKRVDPEEVDVMTMQTANAGGTIGYQFGGLRGKSIRLKNHAIIKEYYQYPSKKYPMGRFIIVASKTLLYAGTMPYMIGEDGKVDYPIIRCVSIIRPGCFWGSCVTERCIPVQRRYNAWRNRKSEYLNLVAIGQWYEPDGSLMEDTELNNEPGNIIRYQPSFNGEKPMPVQFPNLPASFENEGATLMAEFTAISGVSELSRFSEAPSGVKSGRALGIASEQDDTRISTTAGYVANSCIALGKAWMRLYRQFAKEPRILRTVGSNRDVELREWTVSDLRSDDIIVDNVSSLTETPSQRRALVFDLINAQLFARKDISPFSEVGRNKIFEMLEFGNWESEGEDMYWLQRNRARRENMRLTKQGIMPVIQEFDDDEIHIEEHYREMMQVDYEQLLQTPVGPLIDQMMRQHVAMHKERQAQRQLAMMQMRQANAFQRNNDQKREEAQ